MNAEISRSPPGVWRLLAPALCCWALTALAVVRPGFAGVMMFVSALVGTALIAYWLLVRAKVVAGAAPTTPRALLSVLIVFCAVLLLVGARIVSVEQTRADATLQTFAQRGESIAVEAMLTGYPEQRSSDFGDRAWVRAELITASGKVPVLLWLPDAQSVSNQWAPGTAFEIRGRLTAQSPGDSAAYAVQVLDLREALVQPFGARIGSVAAMLRLALVHQAATVPGAELVPGFAVGDTSLVSEGLDAAMLESSLSHLVAVSGSNTGLVIAAMVWLSARLGAGLRARLVVATLALVCFVIVVGPDASVQRAAVMAAVMLASGFGGKRGMAMPGLGVAVLVLLVLNPWQALQPGFALSVAATAGILLCATPLTNWLRRRVRMPLPLALAFAVAIAAQLACGPLLLLLQSGIPAVGVLANVLSAPAAPLGTGLGLIAALLAPFSPGLAHLVVIAASLPAQWVANIAYLAAQMPFGRWSWPEGWPGAVLLAACQVALLIAWWLRSGKLGLPGIGRVGRRQPWQLRALVPRGIRLTVTLLTSAALATIVAVTLVSPITQRLITPRGWAVVACDVGQGDALLLRDPAHPTEVMLIDTGDDPELLHECLSRFGVQRIALLVLSHDDRDHVGALDSVVNRVDAALISPAPRGEHAETREVVRTLQAANVPHRVAEQGDERSSENGISWRTLAPGQGVTPQNSNAASLVLMVEAGATSVLLLGDTGENEQQSLLRSGQTLEAKVLKVAHHGSRDQAAALPAAVGAQWALISVGAGNRYGHPSNDTLVSLTRAGTKTLRTDLHGSIALVPDTDGALDPWIERSQPRATQVKP